MAKRFRAPTVIVVRIRHRSKVYEGQEVTMAVVGTFKIGKREFVVIPRADYLRMGGIPEGSVDALEHANASIGADLRAAREAVGLSQPELAKKLRKSQSMVAGAEAGRIQVSERYVRAVLRACGLPKGWKAKRKH